MVAFTRGDRTGLFVMAGGSGKRKEVAKTRGSSEDTPERQPGGNDYNWVKWRVRGNKDERAVTIGEHDVSQAEKIEAVEVVVLVVCIVAAC